jgi:hypothetical protein
MGRAKEELIECQERGYGSIDKAVCHNCVGNYALKKSIVEKAWINTCDYCNTLDACVSVESLIKEIMEGISFFYENAVGAMAVEKGELIGATVWDSYELLNDLNWDMKLDDKLLEDVNDTIFGDVWCEKDPYALRESEEKSYLWSDFCNIVKTETRYVFFRLRSKDIFNANRPYKILDYIGETVRYFNLITKIPKGTWFYRGRTHHEIQAPTGAKDLCSPPSEVARSNRMSAEGISIFYGAEDVDTTITEIYDSQYAFVTVAPFENLRNLTLLDLTKIQKIKLPSIFDKSNRKYRAAIEFLRELYEEITRPIEYMKSIEYIPVQIISEYFRYLFRYKRKKIDGIIYNSSKNNKKICYALFYNHAQCLPVVQEDKIYGYRQMMRIIDSETRTYKVNASINHNEIRKHHR